MLSPHNGHLGAETPSRETGPSLSHAGDMCLKLFSIEANHRYLDLCASQRVLTPLSEPYMHSPGRPHTSQVRVEVLSARLIQTR